MIVFKKLRWKNFLSTGNLFTEIDLNKHNTTLIIGENGAGKSTILDALSYSLFGKPFRKIKKQQIINSITKKNLMVEVEFSIGPNNFKIVRGNWPTVFEVYQNGELLNQSAEMKDYQEVLEKYILKINHKSFCQVVVLGSATFLPFMQLSTGSRREIIEDLLDLQIFTTMNNLLKEKVTTNKDSIVDIQYNQKSLQEKIKIIREHMLEMQNNNEVIVAEKRERIEQSKKQIDEHNEAVGDLYKLIDELTVQTEGLESLEKKMKKLQGLRHKIEANLAVLNREVSFFHDNDNCPTCKQEIDKDFKCDAIDTRKVNIEEIQEGLSKLSEEYDKTDTEIKKIMSVNDSIRQKTMESNIILTKISSLKTYIKQIESEISSIRQTEEDQDESKLTDLEVEQAQFTQRLHSLNDEKIVLTAASTLLRDGGIKSKIIRQYIPVINKLINKYLSAMEFLVQFELDEEFNETIKSRFRDEFSYTSFSEGEKMRINLAILFAWRAVAKLRNSINTNILIMDEVFDSSLDANGTEEFMKILNTITVDTNTFIISHKTDQISDKFDNVIKFEKHKNFSRIAS
jgi:DNA repair exonuclease SbcCD ATPase subunit